MASPTITPTATRTANRYGYADTNCYCYAYCDTNDYAYSYTYADSYAHAHNKSYPYTNTYCHPQSNSETAPDALQAPQPRRLTLRKVIGDHRPVVSLDVCRQSVRASGGNYRCLPQNPSETAPEAIVQRCVQLLRKFCYGRVDKKVAHCGRTKRVITTTDV
jgi:hypothetical protein